MHPPLGEEEARRHIEIILPAVLRILSADLSLERLGVGAAGRDPLQIFQIRDFRLGVLQVLGRIVRGQNQIVSLTDVLPQPGNHSVGVRRTCDDGMAVMPEHMGVDGVDLGDFDIEGLCGPPNDEIDAADRQPAFADQMSNSVAVAVDGFPYRACKLIDQRLSAAADRIINGVLRGIFGHIGQE